jgi:hypothetical protein
MTLHRPTRSTLGGLLAVSLVAAAPFTPALAGYGYGPNGPEPNIYAPSTATTVWGVETTAPGENPVYEGALATNLCPEALAQPAAFQRRVVADCERGAGIQ